LQEALSAEVSPFYLEKRPFSPYLQMHLPTIFMKKPLIHLICLLLTALSLAQPLQRSVLTESRPETAGFSPDRLTRMDRLIGEYVEAKKIPGAVALIARNGKIVYYKAFGKDDIETGTPLTLRYRPGPKLRSASCLPTLRGSATRPLVPERPMPFTPKRKFPAASERRTLNWPMQ
jgi:hypothetical protein